MEEIDGPVPLVTMDQVNSFIEDSSHLGLNRSKRKKNSKLCVTGYGDGRMA